eukprot:12634962-Heterocapsa_arctica.AAC.1
MAGALPPLGGSPAFGERGGLWALPRVAPIQGGAVAARVRAEPAFAERLERAVLAGAGWSSGACSGSSS